MNKLSNIFFLIICYALLFCVTFWITKYIRSPKKSFSTKIASFPKRSFIINGGIIVLQNGLVWDTGSSNTYLFEDFSSNIFDKKMVAKEFVLDHVNQKEEVDVYFSEKVFIDSLEIKNLYFSIPNKEILSSSLEKMQVQGILGMNVINEANWLINFLTI